MKFKVCNSWDKAKLIENATPAPLDEKNVCTDWIENELFTSYCQPDSKNEYLGYINKTPIMLRYSANSIYVKSVFGKITDTIETEVLNRFTEIFTQPVEDEENELIVLCIQIQPDVWVMSFYFGKYIGG